MNRKYKINLIRSRREYSYQEIADICNCHLRTVQSWKEKGLKVLEGSYKPILVLGSDLKSFLINRRIQDKKPLAQDEFYCTRCNQPRKAISNSISFNFTGRFIGYGKKQVTIQGECQVCSCLLNRFSSEDKIESFLKTLEEVKGTI